VLMTALPGALRKGAALAAEEILWQLTETGRSKALQALPQRATRLRAAVEFLGAAGPSTAEAVLGQAGADGATLRKLLEKGYVERRRAPAPEAVSPAAVRGGPPLNDAQRAVVDTLRKALGTFGCWLVQGVTGSGKTEVYLNVIAAALARGEQALVLVPEIGLTPQLIARFAERCAAPMAILHSGLSD